ncbi:hypothetical protein ACFVQ9_34850 [Streptomyces goshikiensis]|uniref:hypothetical protein n=1 Tax=Streptomyces goshikiensis TaxID=1942 RepID=UPI00367CE2E3
MSASKIIPLYFADAETDHPAVDRWCAAVLDGRPARLLLLGPYWSGKSHTAYAALRRVLAAGYRPDEITARRASDLARTYEPGLTRVETTPVTMVDDVTLAVDLVHEAKGPLRADTVEVQAMMALEAGALAEAIADLVSLPDRSWILIASTPDLLAEAVGADVADRILAAAETAELRQRPLPELRW